MYGGGFTQPCLLGSRGSSYSDSEAWMEGLCSKEGAFRNGTKRILGTAAPLSCFSNFKRMSHFLGSQDPQAQGHLIAQNPQL